MVTATDAGHLARIRRTAQLAQSATSADEVVEHVRGELIERLGLKGCRFELGSLLGHPAQLGPDGEVTAPRGRDVDRQDWPPEEVELRVFGTAATTTGSCSVQDPTVFPPARLVAGTLAGQTGVALADMGAAQSRRTEPERPWPEAVGVKFPLSKAR
ncbi:hypothetical protein [Streptomyces sp. NPDC052811]|uniref:hypothetical protein n=1 Tax=Streptomyces sp. NPDC052811 TaxID=3155731 RepID=UPI0034138327